MVSVGGGVEVGSVPPLGGGVVLESFAVYAFIIRSNSMCIDCIHVDIDCIYVDVDCCMISRLFFAEEKLYAAWSRKSQLLVAIMLLYFGLLAGVL